MTDERAPERDQRREQDQRPDQRLEQDQRPERDSSTLGPATRDEDRPATKDAQPKPKNPNPWTREGADAPDAADIEDPREQR